MLWHTSVRIYIKAERIGSIYITHHRHWFEYCYQSAERDTENEPLQCLTQVRHPVNVGLICWRSHASKHWPVDHRGSICPNNKLKMRKKSIQQYWKINTLVMCGCKRCANWGNWCFFSFDTTFHAQLLLCNKVHNFSCMNNFFWPNCFPKKTNSNGKISFPRLSSVISLSAKYRKHTNEDN